MYLNSFLILALYGATVAYVPESKVFKENVNTSRNNSMDNCEFKIPGLYWRAYTGPPAPEDAVLAGIRHEQGSGVYVGQAPFDVEGAQVQAVAIYNNSEYVTNTYLRTVQTKDGIKILCANSQVRESGLTWIPDDEANIFDPDEDFVVTGHEHSMLTSRNSSLYRGVVRNQFVVGKVVSCVDDCSIFYPNLNGKEMIMIRDFEILGYSKSYYKLKET